MDNIELAIKRLDLVMGFFPRVDSKASWLFATNTGLLAVACLNLRPADINIWYLILPAVLLLALTLASFFFLYRCFFPHLKGGHNSLVYFGAIAERTEANFIAEFLKEAPEDRERDLLGQVWRNSEIVKIKFGAIKNAFILTTIALVPWCVFLIGTAIVHSGVPVLK